MFPPYYTLLLRALGTLEGVALLATEEFKLLEQAYPFVTKRLVQLERDRVPGSALREIFFAADGRTLELPRVIRLVNEVFGADTEGEDVTLPPSIVRYLLSPPEREGAGEGEGGDLGEALVAEVPALLTALGAPEARAFRAILCRSLGAFLAEALVPGAGVDAATPAAGQGTSSGATGAGGGCGRTWARRRRREPLRGLVGLTPDSGQGGGKSVLWRCAAEAARLGPRRGRWAVALPFAARCFALAAARVLRHLFTRFWFRGRRPEAEPEADVEPEPEVEVEARPLAGPQPVGLELEFAQA